MPLVQLAPGLQTTVQDLGRLGYGAQGVSPSGAADPISLRIGNRLLGNPANAAALEMTLMGGSFLFTEAAAVSLTGSDFGATLDGAAVPNWVAFRVTPGQTLKIAHTRTGARCYLCVQGGVVVPTLLGSASTHLLSGLGGVEGRALRKGDVVASGAPHAPRLARVDPKRLNEVAPVRTQMEAPADLVLRVTAGPQASRFTGSPTGAFYAGTYAVTEEANRTGIRLEGPAIEDPSKSQMISEGVALGAIQIPAGGQPIILNVEQQTAGGYPKIANVISADLATLGQLRPRDKVRFELVSIADAIAALRAQEHLLQSEDWLDL